jgi:hypothetical protein
MKRYEQARPLVELARNYGAAFSFGRLVMVSVLLTMGLATCARADTVYTYTGNTFTAFAGSYTCPPECAITGSFTVPNALAADFPLSNVTPTSYSFTDGNTVLDGANSTVVTFAVDTNQQGSIDQWVIEFASPCTFSQPICQTLSTADTAVNGSLDLSNTANSSTYARLPADPGTWEATTTAPEPTSSLLLGSGILGLAAMVFRRKRIA